MKGVIHALPYVFVAVGVLLFVNGIVGLFDANASGSFIGGGNWTSDRSIRLLVMHFGQLAKGVGVAALVFYLARILNRLEQRT